MRARAPFGPYDAATGGARFLLSARARPGTRRGTPRGRRRWLIPCGRGGRNTLSKLLRLTALSSGSDQTNVSNRGTPARTVCRHRGRGTSGRARAAAAAPRARPCSTTTSCGPAHPAPRGAPAPHREVRGRPDAQLPGAGVVEPGDAPPAARVRTERGPGRDLLVRVDVRHRGEHARPRVDPRHRRVRPERERHARAREVRERAQALRPHRAHPRGVHAVRAAPGGVERGLDAQAHPVQQERGERGRVDEQRVLDPVPRRAPRSARAPRPRRRARARARPSRGPR